MKFFIKESIQPFGYFLVPISFVPAGMEVSVDMLFNMRILILAMAISVEALGGKFVSESIAGIVHKANIGWGMVPRG